MGPIGSKVIEVKGQIYVFFFSVCSSQVLGPIFTNFGEKVEGGPGYQLVGFIEVNGQIYGFFSVCSPTSPRSLDRSPNLVGRWRAAPDISSRGSFFKGQGHRGQR